MQTSINLRLRQQGADTGLPGITEPHWVRAKEAAAGWRRTVSQDGHGDEELPQARMVAASGMQTGE